MVGGFSRFLEVHTNCESIGIDERLVAALVLADLAGNIEDGLLGYGMMWEP